METPAGASSPASSLLTQKAAPWAKSARAYHPLVDTLAIYAGWLLAWYLGIVSLTQLAQLRSLDIFPGFFYEIVASSSLFLAAFACFLFLLGRYVYRLLGRRFFVGVILVIVEIAAFALYYINIV